VSHGIRFADFTQLRRIAGCPPRCILVLCDRRPSADHRHPVLCREQFEKLEMSLLRDRRGGMSEHHREQRETQQM
jgi:hypothetical protein